MPVTSAVSVARLTVADLTPFTAFSARSTRPAQEAQVMPVIGRATVVSMRGAVMVRSSFAVGTCPIWTFPSWEGQPLAENYLRAAGISTDASSDFKRVEHPRAGRFRRRNQAYWPYVADRSAEAKPVVLAEMR
jgi:hypothetical protein